MSFYVFHVSARARIQGRMFFRAAAHFLTCQGIDLHRHQVRDLYFRIMKEQQGDSSQEHPEFDAWEWVRPERLPELIVPFKRQLYLDVLAEFHDLLPPPRQLRQAD